MDLLTLAAVLAAALSHAAWNALIKSGADPLRSSVGLTLCWTVLGGPLLFAVPPPRGEVAWLLAATVVVHVVYFALLVHAYRLSDFSIVYPIARGLPPVLVLMASAALGEDALTPPGVAGVLLVSVGIASLARGVSSAHRRGAGVAVVTALLIAAYTVIDGMGARRATSPAAFMVWLAIVHGAVYTLGAVLLKGLAVLPATRPELLRALSSGGLAGGGYLVVLWAMARAPIAIVSALRETGVLFGAIIGVAVLREPLGARRLASAALIAAGIAWIQVGT